MTENVVTVTRGKNNVVVSTPGPQGPRGRTILNGAGAPSNNLGLEGDFYYDTVSTRFYGPKPNDLSWAGAQNYILNNPPSDYSAVVPWSIGQVVDDKPNGYYVLIEHNLGFYPNVTVKTSGNHILETGIEYDNQDNNKLKLRMAQPFAGTAYLS